MTKQVQNILIAIIVGSVIFILSKSFFDDTQSRLLGLIFFLVTLWSNEALPLGVVSLLPIVLFPVFGLLNTKDTALNYANPIIFLFLGGFLLAIAVEKTRLHIYIADKILNFFPATPRGVIFSLATTSALLSSILSNTTTTLLLVSIAIFLTENIKLKMRFTLAIAYGASAGGILTPIGTPPNLILLGLMQEKSMEIIPFFKWIWMVSPLVFMMILSIGSLLSLGVKNVEITRVPQLIPLTKIQKKVLSVLAILVILLLVNSPIQPYWNGLGLSESSVLLSFGLLLFMPPFSILEWKKDTYKVPYEIMFLFGAGFSIAKAFAAVGLADATASYLLAMTNLSPILLLLSVATLVTFTTEITSNTALTAIILPVIYAISEQSGINTTLFMMVATLCASYAFMLPIATGPNAIAMSSGAVNVVDMLRYGIVLNILGIFFIVMLAEYLFKIAL